MKLTQPTTPASEARTFPSRLFLAKMLLGIAGSALAIVPAGANTVAGHVFTPDEKPAANMTLTATPAKGEAVEFKTDKSGVYRVNLDPGRYSITVSTDLSIQAVVESYPQPVQQDIHLRKGPH